MNGNVCFNIESTFFVRVRSDFENVFVYYVCSFMFYIADINGLFQNELHFLKQKVSFLFISLYRLIHILKMFPNMELLQYSELYILCNLHIFVQQTTFDIVYEIRIV